MLLSVTATSQIGNYVTNGSFENVDGCIQPFLLNQAVGWNSIGSDTTRLAGPLYSTHCGNAPYTDVGFQIPHSGNTFLRSTPYCMTYCPYDASRGYPKNRLKTNLKANKVYCTKMFVCRQNFCTYAISNIGFYFSDNTTDTINYANSPIDYLTPQVMNPPNNIIADTMNWVAIGGTFVATGNEKYLIIGNFLSNALTTASLVDNSWPGIWAEYFFDDVSCIEVDLPAYAGPDKALAPGDSVYIGRENDFAIDSGCTWYQLPNLLTPIKNKTSGFWAKPVTTTTYVVKQILDCSAEKWDTVVAHMNYVGIVSSSVVENGLRLFPIPASDQLELKISNPELFKDYTLLVIYNQLGQIVREEKFRAEENILKLKLDLANGVYSLSLKSDKSTTVSKRFLVSR